MSLGIVLICVFIFFGIAAVVDAIRGKGERTRKAERDAFVEGFFHGKHWPNSDLYLWEAWRRYPGKGDVTDQPEVKEKIKEMYAELKRQIE